MRKVKFTQDSFDEKLSAILTEFPVLDVSETCHFLNDDIVESFSTVAMFEGHTALLCDNPKRRCTG